MAQDGKELAQSNLPEEGAVGQNHPYSAYPFDTKKKQTTTKIWSHLNLVDGDHREPPKVYIPYPTSGFSSSDYPFVTEPGPFNPAILSDRIMLDHGTGYDIDEPLDLGFKRDNIVPKAEISSGSEPVKKRKESQCSLCANHYSYVLMKGHKFDCPNRECPCEDCDNTRKRQHFTKLQQKISRKSKTDNRQNCAEEASSSKEKPIPSIQLTPPRAYPQPRLEELKPILKEDTSHLFGQINDLCSLYKKKKK